MQSMGIASLHPSYALIQQFGDQYRRYRHHASMLVPLPGRKFTGPKDADV
jgi:methanethiol S-methyltransferase